MTQTAQTLKDCGIDEEIGVIKAGYKPSLDADIQIASVQTLTARKLLPPDGAVTIIDECHTTAFFSILRHWIPKADGFVIGVTATPRRQKKSEGMALLFQDFVCAPSPSELIQMGFLAPARVLGYKETFNLKGVKTQAGDFKKDDLAKACNVEESNRTIVDETISHIGDRTGIIFAVDVKHAHDLAHGFNLDGYKTEVVTGETTRAERQAMYQRLRSGETQLISSVGVLTEGFDVRSIECVILARPTKSWALYVQMFGRGLRTNDGKDYCLVLDFAGNHARHGIASQVTRDEMAPDYPDPVKGEAPTRECPKCNLVQRAQNQICEECGYEFPIKDAKKDAIKGKLVEISSDLIENRSDKMAEKFGKWMILAMENDYSPGFAKMKFKEFYHRPPKKEEMWQSAFCGDESRKQEMWDWLCRQAKKKGKPESWAIGIFKYEFGELKHGTDKTAL